MCYQTGIQDLVYNIILDSRKKGLPYIRKKDIINRIESDGIKLKNPNPQVSQALYQLQRQTTFRRQKIKKFFESGRAVGWTTYDDIIVML